MTNETAEQQQKFPIHVQLDMETLHTGPRTVVLSVGMAAYSYGKGVFDTFEAVVRIEDQLRAGRRMSDDTLGWWMTQSAEARESAFSPKRAQYSANVLQAMRIWWKFVVNNRAVYSEGHFESETRLWSNGADFDVAILRDMHDELSHTPFWDFRKVRCFRTMLETFAPTKAEKEIVYPTERSAHNARQDATNQAYAHLVLMDKFEILRR